MDKFYLNGILIDVSRGEVVTHDTVHCVEPKAMAVLVHLAKTPLSVVSQESLFNAVWPNGVFNPGVLQRCIAQLRKALGDDAKQPLFIKTHPKRGYSLDVQPQANNAQTAPNTKLRSGVAALVVMLLIGAGLMWLITGSDKSSTSLSIEGNLKVITSSSHYDFYPVFSKNERQLAFIRQTENANQIIMADIEHNTQQVLLESEDNYQAITWSDDGLSLFYLKRERGNDLIGKLDLSTKTAVDVYRHDGTNEIWRLFLHSGSLYFSAAQVPLNQSPTSALYKLDLLTSTVSTLLKSTSSFTPYRFALSPDKAEFAIAGESNANNIELRTFDLLTDTLSEPFATLPLGFTELNWYDNNNLIVHHLNRLYLLDKKGHKTRLPVNHFMRLFNPVAAPNTGQIAMSMTEYDTDIVGLDVNSLKSGLVVDSAGEDHLASVSPNGRYLAYVSARSGVQEVIVASYAPTNDASALNTNSVMAINVFNNEENKPIYRAPVWDKNSRRVAFAFENDILIYDLASQTTRRFTMPSRFTSILDWYSKEDSLLVTTKNDNTSYFEKLDVATQQFTQLAQTGVNFAATLDNNDQLIFGFEDKLSWRGKLFTHPLFAQSTGRYFPLDGLVVFQVGRQLFTFDGSVSAASRIEIPPNADHLIGVFGEQWLFQTQNSRSAKIVLLE